MDFESEHSGKPLSDSTKSLAVGTRVRHYRILQLLGSGGMGAVYLAMDTRLNRKVALKFLHIDRSAKSQLLERTLTEARSASRLNHPNIVSIFSVEDNDGRPFVAMEYAEGRTLTEVIAADHLDGMQIIDISLQLCAGIACAHELGVIHRDLKPDNILITSKGQVKILDFGVADAKAEATTEAGDSMTGTLAYLSPEQALGNAIDLRSDLFSLGVVLYQLASGRLPFRGDYEASILFAIANDQPEPLHAQRPDLPPALLQIVDKLLQKAPSARYQSALEVAGDLRKIHVRAREAGGMWSSKRHIGVLIAIGLILAFVAGGYWLIRADKLRSAQNRQEMRPKVAVLPFANLGTPTDEYFADGMSDAITAHLVNLGGLAVTSRSSAMQYKHPNKTLRAVGDELEVDYILTGTLLWEKTTSGDLVHIRPQLVQTREDICVWTQTYDRVLENIFLTQSEIAANVARAMDIEILEPEQRTISTAPTSNLEAYDAFLRGNSYFNRSWRRTDISIAAQMYERAVQLDSTFALGYAMLARAHASMYWEYFDRTAERLSRAHAAALNSVRLRPDLPEAHVARGYYFYHCYLNYDSALAEFETARRIQPNNSELLNAIAAVERRRGHLDASLANFKLAYSLDPRAHTKALDIALTSGMMRNYDTAMVYLDRTLSMAPDWDLPYILKAWILLISTGDRDAARAALGSAVGQADLSGNPYYWWLSRILYDYEARLSQSASGTHLVQYHLHRGQTYRLMGREASMRASYDSARVLLEARLDTLPDDARFHSQLGIAYAGLGRFDEAMREGARAMELLPTSRDAFDAPFLIVNFAEACVMAGRYEDAIAKLEFLLSIPGFVTPAYLELDPIWGPLHSQPKFQKLCKSPTL